MMKTLINSIHINILAPNHHINVPKPNSTLIFTKLSNNSKNITFYSNSSSPATQLTHCLPLSKSQEEIDTESTGSSKLVCVKFQLEKECQYGDHFLMVGDDPILGSWNPSEAVPFNWSEGHIWALVLELPVDKSIRYKFLLKNSTGEILWQPGPDRVFQSWDTNNVIIVSDKWENEEAQKISEEHEIIEEEEELIAGALVDPSVIALPDEHSEGSPLPIVSNNIEMSGLDENVDPEDCTNGNSSSSVRAPIKSGNSQEDLPTRKSSQKVTEDEGSLVIDDEGVVLVPGLTLPFISTEDDQVRGHKSIPLFDISLGPDDIPEKPL